MKKGALITLYGINNIGKTTHAKKLCERLKISGRDAVYMKFPRYDLEPSGPFINEVLRGGKIKIAEDELQMWFTLNRYQALPELNRLREEGKTIIAEDYVGTGIAWGITKGLDREWLEKLNAYLPKEDLALMLHGERAIKAKEDGHLHEDNEELMARSKEIHEELADRYGWEKIQLQDRKQDTAELVFKVVDEFLK